MSSQPDASQLSTLNSRILKQYWGYDRFRGIQEDIIDSISKNKDTLGLMPTGGGKSITFQVPALAKEGMCLVITPLIALMKDQVQNLKKRGIKALAIYSGMSRQDIIITLENCIFGNYKFLYISPERLDTEIFRTKLRKMHISMITVDESHCISQWGYDFRPAYLKIAEIRELLPDVPVLALTATATPEVVKDIQARLHFRHKNVFRMSFERNNLAYIVRKTENKTAELLHILRSMPGSAIVYVRNRRRTKEITERNPSSPDFFIKLSDPQRHLFANKMSEMPEMSKYSRGTESFQQFAIRIADMLLEPEKFRELYQCLEKAGFQA
jgi:ATP-dependent DNA helicase RecQ